MARRSLLTRQERQDGIARRAQLRREAMTPEQVEDLMRKTMHDCLDANGVVSRGDLIRANIPPKAIDGNFGRILKQVLVERKKAGIRA